MNAQTASTTGIARGRSLALASLIAASFCTVLPSGLLAAESSPAPVTVASLEPTIAPAEAVCESADDLDVIIGFLRDTEVSEEGWVPVLVGVIAGLSEARQLAGFVGDSYRPLIEDLIVSLEGLRTTVEELRDQETAGAQLVAIGESITAIGVAMDALSIQLQTDCPTDE